MIKCGTDIIEIARVKDAIEKEGFKERVYTEREIKYCESKNVQKYQSYSGRFAAKEAIFKALSSIIEDKYKIKWTDFEIINDKEGKPNVQINTNIIDKSLIKNIDISISHCKEYATAVCIIEINN
jgi:holo-[acyl-carrier protein] synthase